MSTPFATGPNPYASPVMPPAPAPILPAGSPVLSIEYMRAYGYIFENPTWTTTVLLIGLCSLAAIIPGVSILLNLLFLGYQFEAIHGLLATQGRQYPTFDFGKIGDYLSRGLWPFLVNLVANFVAIPILYVGLFAGIFAAGGLISAEDELPQVLGVVLVVVVVLVFSVALIVAGFYLTAMTLRAGLAQDFAAAFNFGWVNDFVSRTWLPMLLVGLFLGATGFALGTLGLLACLIGIVFVIPILLLAYSHLLYQLYALYLARGGTPVVGKTQYLQPSLGPSPPPKPL